jgi:DNA-binding transcriptional regulator LsrR (DeoR family)
VSVSTVSRLLNRAFEQGILEVRVIPPHIDHLQEKLLEQLASKNVRSVSVVPNGPDKNVENLGWVGAQQVFKAIQSVARQNTAGRKLRIAVSSDTKIAVVVESLLSLLQQEHLEGGGVIPELEIYPTVLFGDSQLHPIYPHTMAAYFAMMARNLGLIGRDQQPLISAHALQLPNHFYKCPREQREEFKRAWGLYEFVGKIKSADIFLFGASSVGDDSYHQITKALSIQVEARKDLASIQLLYTPLDSNGLPDSAIDKIIGVTAVDMRDIAADKEKHVIMIAGGTDIIVPIQSVIDFPCYNNLVTDAGVANEAIRRSANRASSPNTARPVESYAPSAIH